MSKKYFFFREEDDDMGRRNKKKNRNKTSTARSIVKTFGFGQGAKPSNDEERTSFFSSEPIKYFKSYQKQDALDPDRVLSSNHGFLEGHHSDAWGTVLVPVEDPKAVSVTEDELNGIKLIDNFPKIPAAKWSRWIKLAKHFAELKKQMQPQKPRVTKMWNHEIRGYDYYQHIDGEKIKIEDPETTLGPGAKYGAIAGIEYDSYTPPSTYQNELEVSVLLCRKVDDLSQWKILVPKQHVSHSSVRADTAPNIDIETGEIYELFPPAGWCHAGSSHSHNTFAPFFSSTDDGSELTVPGLHIVVGYIKSETYEARASIVLRKLRKHVDVKDVVETDDVEDAVFHESVLSFVTQFSSEPTGPTAWATKDSDKKDSDGKDLEKVSEKTESDSDESEPGWWLPEHERSLHPENNPSCFTQEDFEDYCGWI